MSDKILNTRVKQKIDTKANWDKAVNFVPLKGEIVVYSDLNKIKVGDGVTKVGSLPFLADSDTKVTSAANHYTPTADSRSELTATLPGTAGAYAKDTEYTVLTGVKAQRDAKGHITGLTYTAQKIKDTNTTYTFNGAVSTIKDSNLTASRALISDNSGKVVVSDVTSAELSYLDGVTSSIQTQLNAKLDKTTYEWNKEFAAGSNGAISLGRYNIYDSQLTFDITSTTNQSLSGKLVIATQNGTINQAKVFGDASGTLASKLIIYQSAISNSRSWVEVFCNFNGWSKNKVHIYAVALNSATVQKQMTSVTISNGVPAAANVTSGDTKWTGTIVNDFNHSHGNYQPKGNYVTTDTVQTISAKKTFSATPELSAIKNKKVIGTDANGLIEAHTLGISDISNLQSTLNGKANASHTHTISQINNLQDALDKKFDKTGGTITGYTDIKVNTPSSGDFIPLFSVTTPKNSNGFTWYTQNDGESAGQSYIAFADHYPIYLKMWNNNEYNYQKIYLPSTNGLQDRTIATEDYVDNKVSGYESWTFTTLSGTTITKKVCIHN